mgnify:CR=1 FL=1
MNQFDKFIDESVLYTIETQNISDFKNLLYNLPGIYPFEVFQSLKRLKINSHLKYILLESSKKKITYKQFPIR